MTDEKQTTRERLEWRQAELWTWEARACTDPAAEAEAWVEAVMALVGATLTEAAR